MKNHQKNLINEQKNLWIAQEKIKKHMRINRIDKITEITSNLDNSNQFIITTPAKNSSPKTQVTSYQNINKNLKKQQNKQLQQQNQQQQQPQILIQSQKLTKLNLNQTSDKNNQIQTITNKISKKSLSDLTQHLQQLSSSKLGKTYFKKNQPKNVTASEKCKFFNSHFHNQDQELFSSSVQINAPVHSQNYNNFYTFNQNHNNQNKSNRIKRFQQEPFYNLDDTNSNSKKYFQNSQEQFKSQFNFIKKTKSKSYIKSFTPKNTQNVALNFNQSVQQQQQQSTKYSTISEEELNPLIFGQSNSQFKQKPQFLSKTKIQSKKSEEIQKKYRPVSSAISKKSTQSHFNFNKFNNNNNNYNNNNDSNSKSQTIKNSRKSSIFISQQHSILKNAKLNSKSHSKSKNQINPKISQNQQKKNQTLKILKNSKILAEQKKIIQQLLQSNLSEITSQTVLNRKNQIEEKIKQIKKMSNTFGSQKDQEAFYNSFQFLEFFQKQMFRLQQSKFQSDYIINKIYEQLDLQLKLINQAKSDIQQNIILKYLHLSWLCDDSKNEIQAYKLFALYYFYEENLEFANYYFRKCDQGILEKSDSKTKKLAIKTLLISMKNRKKRVGTIQPPSIEDPYNILSSEDEETENLTHLYPVPKEDTYLTKYMKIHKNDKKKFNSIQQFFEQQDQQEQEENNNDKEYEIKQQQKLIEDMEENDIENLNFKLNPKKYQLNFYNLRHNLPFNPGNHGKQIRKQVIENANRNIYQPRQITSEELINRPVPRLQVKRRQVEYQQLREKFYVNHLSNLRTQINRDEVKNHDPQSFYLLTRESFDKK
ncbi:hypothetical protein PPERSA_08297 [Pseudocohnilembus persalinus]|uniref:Uncharacterized protein n=1 Tax=Pseudocohnilembus persalinus TaxID=266149 RepID=A0A0V0QPC6_PSEPJ|nr:hypothetical protein PPERSA_08297 [Pseudocohnilembus persalinus]|eukprot:KRX04082.1 hypothetical protein PPERSA_08297 [Pseudocohnilembus persalinus]